MIDTRPKKNHERAVLVGLEQAGVSKWDLSDSLEELAELANSAGAEVVDTVTQRLRKPTAPYYIGKGKAESIKDSLQDRQITSVIFDDELSPAQGRNLENLLARKVIDRTQLILDIFAQRARSREGRLQIELAQLQYLLPRLTRMWHHLSRQTGGIGTRGPGETQLEVDRRRVQERIARLERELEAVRKTRAVQRQGRKRHQLPQPAIDAVCAPGAGRRVFCGPLPVRARAVRSVPARDDGPLPTGFHPDHACRSRPFVATGGATCVSVAAISIAVAPAQSASGLRGCVRAAQKYRARDGCGRALCARANFRDCGPVRAKVRRRKSRK